MNERRRGEVGMDTALKGKTINELKVEIETRRDDLAIRYQEMMEAQLRVSRALNQMGEDTDPTKISLQQQEMLRTALTELRKATLQVVNELSRLDQQAEQFEMALPLVPQNQEIAEA